MASRNISLQDTIRMVLENPDSDDDLRSDASSERPEDIEEIIPDFRCRRTTTLMTRNGKRLTNMMTEMKVGSRRGGTEMNTFRRMTKMTAIEAMTTACVTYSCCRRALRWPMCEFFHMLDISSYSAFVLLTEIYPEWNVKKSYKRRLFLEELGKALIRPEVLKREPPPSAEGLGEQRVGPPSKRKQCGLCTKPLRASNIINNN
ncbi:uncharacterized protein LOC130916694 [Corythoichthys intestinalis]|uniref:uncharacterized protein LOC130916694 n=1 Tax=Corythoichthys intestinalis TaxID=161448 RepID=UPI0025A527C3|nr:uncharacterized protein LOC130916694 [Corythoichthys intestinalis]